jgi:carboxyl-terminal processing protease
VRYRRRGLEMGSDLNKLLAGGILAVAISSCGSAPGSGPGAASAGWSITSEQAILDFDSAWSRIANSYYDPEFGGLDWQGVRAELRPRAEAATTLRELRRVIGEMLARIGESHFGLIPREVADALDPVEETPSAAVRPGEIGLQLRLVAGRLLVYRVAEEGAAAASGVCPGWILDAVGDVAMADLIRTAERAERHIGAHGASWQVVRRGESLLGGAPGSSVAVTFLDGEDQPVVLTLTRAPVRGEPVRLGNLPTFYADLEHRRLEGPDGCIGMIRFNVWMTALASPFEQVMNMLADCVGIVLDLRGNPGGVGAMVMGVSGYFVDQRETLGTMRTRGQEIRFVSIPRRVTSGGEPARPFSGALAILTDPYTGSTSEIFSAGMQQLGKARLFGETTAGMALPALALRLPSQDVLYHAIADLRAPDGSRIEGRGVAPDVAIPLTRDQLLAGRDAPLEAALAWIRGTERFPAGTRLPVRSR